MSGVAVHGNKHFDTALVSVITSDLWMGGCTDGLVLPREVTDVVSLYPWERYTVRHELRSFLEVRMYDAAAIPNRDEVDRLADWVNARRSDGVVLVHCQAGLNRSGLVTAVALVRSGMSGADAIGLLRANRCDAVLCNPTFHEFVWRYAS